MPPVEISGIVESVANNIFSKDPEFLVSIVCPDPYFTALEPKVITGSAIRPGGVIDTITYDGSVEAGMYVEVSSVAGPAPTTIDIQIGDPAITYFSTVASVDAGKYFEMSSIPMQKYVQNVSITSGVITNLLSKVNIEEGSSWPVFQPGESEFSVITNQGTQDWTLKYFERFGGL
jgi:hypothetical protein